MNDLEQPSRPAVVIGAGPVGLAAAAHLVARGQDVLILEAGEQAGANLQTYRHVRLFSRWKHNVDPVAVELLTANGWVYPDPELLPTAGAVVDHYLAPLAALPAIASSLRLRHRVTDVARVGHDKVTSAGREQAPFLIRAETPDGVREYQACAVFDAAGTWNQPSPLGANGLAALGEPGLSSCILYGMPDVAGAYRARYANRRVLVVGAGHSAVGNLLALAQLAEDEPATRIVWAIRRADAGKVFGNPDPHVQPSERAKLGLRLKALYDAGKIELHTGFRVQALRADGDGITVAGEAAGAPAPAPFTVDQIICSTGARADWHMTCELRLRFDALLGTTDALADLIDPNLHSCGLRRPLTIDDLVHPEPNYFRIGAKSYGRAPNFLMGTGYDQVQVVVDEFVSRRAAARAHGA